MWIQDNGINCVKIEFKRNSYWKSFFRSAHYKPYILNFEEKRCRNIKDYASIYIHAYNDKSCINSTESNHLWPKTDLYSIHLHQNEQHIEYVLVIENLHIESTGTERARERKKNAATGNNRVMCKWLNASSRLWDIGIRSNVHPHL